MKQTFDEFVRLMHDDAIVKSIPAHGTFTLTSRCNLHCRMCFICNPSIAAEELSGDQWLDIMKQARDAGMTFALITGGEPLLHKDFWQIYTGLRKLGVYVTVNSNGTTITPEIVDMFKKNPPVRVAISVYGASPEAYEKVTGSAAAYEKLVQSLELLRDRGINLRLRTMLTKDIAPDMVNIVKFILSYGVPFSYGNYIMPSIWENRNDYKSQRLSGQEIAEYTEIIENAIKEYHDTHGNPRAHISEKVHEGHEAQIAKPKDPKRLELHRLANKIKSKTAFKCGAGLSHFSVTHDGFIHLCELTLDPMFDLKQMSFKEGFKRIGEVIAGIPECAECVNCPDRAKCMPCPPRHFAETGSYDKAADYVCEYAKAGVKLLE